VHSAIYYRFNWALGSFLALVLDELHKGSLAKPTLDEWPSTGLPWAAFWMKELMTWGTLDPVTSFVLSRHGARTREEAAAIAHEYFSDMRALGLTPNEQLNPRLIRDWLEDRLARPGHQILQTVPQEILVTLSRDFSRQLRERWRVLPVELQSELHWTDPTGVTLATSNRPDDWPSEAATVFDFELVPASERVIVTPFSSGG
jgi:hypothetical protein